MQVSTPSIRLAVRDRSNLRLNSNLIDVRCPFSRLAEEAARVFTGMFNAAMYFDLHRVSELFCGFPGDEGEAPFWGAPLD